MPVRGWGCAVKGRAARDVPPREVSQVSTYLVLLTYVREESTRGVPELGHRERASSLQLSLSRVGRHVIMPLAKVHPPSAQSGSAEMGATSAFSAMTLLLCTFATRTHALTNNATRHPPLQTTEAQARLVPPPPPSPLASTRPPSWRWGYTSSGPGPLSRSRKQKSLPLGWERFSTVWSTPTT